MIKTNNLAALILVLIFSISCNENINKLETIPSKKHLRFLICSDLSNRLTKYPKTLEDSTLIAHFLEFYYPNIYKSANRDNGQKDKIEVLFLNGMDVKNYKVDTEKLNLDLSKFNNMQRIKYLTNNIKGFKEDKKAFKGEIKKLYDSASMNIKGADIYSLLKSKIRGITNDENKYRNILLLFTDGYIEYGSNQKNGKKTYFLNRKVISDFRKAFKKSKTNSLKNFFDENEYGIVPVNNPNLKNLEIIALEFYDRSLTKTGNPTVRPTDQEIIELFWEDWMKKSKVKRFMHYNYFSSKKKFESSIMDFIENESKYIMN
ncbi:hypothetical protein [uncultured Kordia sp.]|uniref:hypothetical protein n=1 Tax=uncultured Kordia sp. TaxID=507699 RepID=UPI00261848CC|nr:hypothetical protein [uncultured Kordia sp.]